MDSKNGENSLDGKSRTSAQSKGSLSKKKSIESLKPMSVERISSQSTFREGGSRNRKEDNRIEGIEEEYHTEFKKFCHYDEVPDWLRDNEFLRTGYRHQIKSVTACFKTIFSCHTETGNIWTHLIGGLMFFVYMCAFAVDYFGKIPFLDYLEVIFFFSGAIVCFILSAIYHTIKCYSEEIVIAFARLDYIGINLLITASHAPWIYFAFYCRKQLRNTYMAINLLASAIIALLSLYDRFGETDNRHVRSSLFGAFALFCIFPICHCIQLEGWHQAYMQTSLGWLLIMGFTYLVGGVLYSARIPERFRPGAFDVFFHSHQLMHILTVIGTYVHMQSVFDMVKYRMEVGPCKFD